MRTFVLSDNEAVSAQLREILLGEGHECVVSHLVHTDLVAGSLAVSRPEMVLIVLSPEPESALPLLSAARKMIQARVLAVGPALEPKMILQALREGADQYLDEAELEAELRGVLARQQSTETVQAKPGRLISVLAASGGTGSSTLSVNLAAVLAQEHKSCVLVDLKPGSGDLAALLDLKPTHTLADLCLNVARMDRGMFDRSLVRHPSGVHLLAPPRTIAEFSLVTPQAVHHALTMASMLYPYGVVDLDDCFHQEQMQALRQADVILLVLRLDFTSLRNTRRSLDHLEQLGIDRERVRLVVNRYGQPKELPADKAKEALGMEIFHYVPEDPKTVNRANNNGVPAVLEAPRASVSRSIAKLAVSLNGQCHR